MNVVLFCPYTVWLICLLVCTAQGEKGEPGFVIRADGSVVSGLAGPMGPKGVKVRFDLTVCTACIDIFTEDFLAY